MSEQSFQEVGRNSPQAIPTEMRRVEGREWWLWGFAIAVTLALTLGIISFTFPWFHREGEVSYWFDLREWVRGLAGLVLLFDFYAIYQQLLLQGIRRQLAERDQLFQLISENAADMIALVDSEGRRLYNSPAYLKVLGYTPEELQETSSLEQVHPGDRARVVEAGETARRTGRGERMEYRIRHKDGSWRTIESTASPIRDAKGGPDKLVIVNRDITERKRAEEQLAHNAFHDGLTDLPNRALFLDRLQHALDLSRRYSNCKFAVLLIDIDEFKVINDSLGHSAGDALLIQIAQRLKNVVRRADTVSRAQNGAGEGLELSRAAELSGNSSESGNDEALARLGGDEFTILLDDVKDVVEAVRVAERLQAALQAPFLVKQQHIVLSASIGIAASAGPHARAEDLLRDADIAMYRAKKAGKARCEVSDSAMHANAVKRLSLETDLRKGLDHGEFRVHYQPIVSLRNGRILGFEALSRWLRPEGLVAPAQFLGVAEETGLIIPMNRQAMREACLRLRSWQGLFPGQPPLSMSVNITSKEFAQPDLVHDIRKCLEETGISPDCLHLEITETIAMGDAEKSGQVLAQLKACGIRMGIDDFGTGYSSLGRLRRIPVDTLKIDRSFISNVHNDPESREIVRAVIALAHNLGLKVVAEGAEIEEHVRVLKELDCEMAQGYLFSRAADDQTVLQLLAANRRAAAGV